MKRALAALCSAAVVMTAPAPAFSQSNNNDYTPLNSRIRRDRQFPTQLRNYIDPARMTKVTRERSKAMLGQFSKCLYDRSNEQSLALLARTDLGFVNFQQIDIDSDRAARLYGFSDCLRRVAQSFNIGVQLSFTAGGLRQWLLQEAYYARYPEGPSWVKAGNMVGERQFPLTPDARGLRASLDFADCVVLADPYGADFFFRAEAGSADAQSAISGLTPSLGPCLPQGARVEMTPQLLRLWLGEALWHAANNSAPAPAEAAQGAQ